MSISVATGFHRFVCGVRLFRGLQGKQRGGTSHQVAGATRSPGRTSLNDPRARLPLPSREVLPSIQSGSRRDD
jgi:hypothetical protein